jgi:uncharacterized protein
MMHRSLLLPLALCALPLAGCAGQDAQTQAAAPAGMIVVTIQSSNGQHRFTVQRAVTSADQEKGLMYRTDIADDGGMLFWPYPPDGAAPRAASFWMKNTPSPLDIIFIRPDGTIARIAENTVPFSEDHVDSGEPVGAVLEIKGGRASALGIAEGDAVSWPK